VGYYSGGEGSISLLKTFVDIRSSQPYSCGYVTLAITGLLGPLLLVPLVLLGLGFLGRRHLTPSISNRNTTMKINFFSHEHEVLLSKLEYRDMLVFDPYSPSAFPPYLEKEDHGGDGFVDIN
jgi:hypothetical protein